MPIGDKAWEEFIVSSEAKQIFRRAMVHFDEKSPRFITEEDLLTNPDVKLTNGTYELIYRPIAKQKENSREYPFIVRSDLLKGCKIRVRDYNMLECLAKERKEIAFLLKWTTLTRELFGVAKQNFNTPFCFTMKWKEYSETIKAKDPEAPMAYKKEEWVVGEKYRAMRVANKK